MKTKTLQIEPPGKRKRRKLCESWNEEIRRAIESRGLEEGPRPERGEENGNTAIAVIICKG